MSGSSLFRSKQAHPTWRWCAALLASILVAWVPPVSAQPEALGSIEGTITDADTGSPVADLWVNGFSIDGSDRSINGFTNDSGHFELSQQYPEDLPGVVPGTYVLLTGNTDVWASPYTLTWWRNGRDRVDADPVEVRAGEVAVSDFELELGGRIVGRVVDADTGAPIEGVEVSYVVASPSPQVGSTMAGRSAADGSFVIEGLSEFGYKVCFGKGGYRSECWKDAYLSAGAGGAETPGTVLEMTLGATIELAVDLAPGNFAGWFWDDDSSEFQRDIDWLAEARIVRGCNPPFDDQYCPDLPITRAQLAAMFHRAFPDLRVETPSIFADVDPLFAADIAWLSAAGITRGCNPPDNDLFCPGDTVSRGQTAAMLVRALGLEGAVGVDHFLDDDESLFEADIERIAATAITRGCNPPVNDRFCPAAMVTRAQLAAFLHRALR